MFDGVLHTDRETLAHETAARGTLRHESLHAQLHAERRTSRADEDAKVEHDPRADGGAAAGHMGSAQQATTKTSSAHASSAHASTVNVSEGTSLSAVPPKYQSVGKKSSSVAASSATSFRNRSSRASSNAAGKSAIAQSSVIVRSAMKSVATNGRTSFAAPTNSG